MSAKIIPFPGQQHFDRIFRAEREHRNLVTALAEWREKQERARRAAEQIRGYEAWGRNHPDDEPPSAA